MNELTVFKFNNIDVVDSREVAEMIGKRHDHLIRDIKNYFDVLMKNTSPNFGVSDFFIKSSYKDSTGRTLLCYLLTKKGCDMVANKMTGEKGVLFTAAYVTAFESMRHNQNSYDDLVQILTSVDSVLKNIAAKLDAVCTRASIPESKNKPYEIKDETAMSAWKAQVYSVAKPLARRMDVTVKCLLSKIYTRMKNEYSWDYKEEKKNYQWETGAGPNVSTLDIIEGSSMYKSIFMAILKDLYEENTPGAPKTASLVPVSSAKVIDVEETKKKVEPEKSKKSATTKLPWVQQAAQFINDYGEERGDRSPNYAVTYRLVFKAIGDSEMNKIRKSYFKKCGIPKTQILMFNTSSRVQLVENAVAKLRKEASHD